MKKLSLLLILFTLVFITGCDKEEDKKQIEEYVEILITQATKEYQDAIKSGHGVMDSMNAKEVNVKKKPEGGKIYFESSMSSAEPIVTAEKIIYGEYTCSYNKKVTCKK